MIVLPGTKKNRSNLSFKAAGAQSNTIQEVAAPATEHLAAMGVEWGYQRSLGATSENVSNHEKDMNSKDISKYHFPLLKCENASAWLTEFHQEDVWEIHRNSRGLFGNDRSSDFLFRENGEGELKLGCHAKLFWSIVKNRL